jgi:plasmid stabilization system protein ParE
VEVIVSPAAKADIRRASLWLESARSGLGSEFLVSVDQAVEKIGRNPLTFRKVKGENRRVNLERFDYALFYRVEGQAIVVAGVHGRRDPKYLKERASGVTPIRHKPRREE